MMPLSYDNKEGATNALKNWAPCILPMFALLSGALQELDLGNLPYLADLRPS